MSSKTFSYVISFGCIAVMIYCLAMTKAMEQRNEYLTSRVMQLKADSTAQSYVTRKYARWHWQLDNLTRSQLDSVVKADKQKRVVKHIAGK